jgi:hypothetical protein
MRGVKTVYFVDTHAGCTTIILKYTYYIGHAHIHDDIIVTNVIITKV